MRASKGNTAARAIAVFLEAPTLDAKPGNLPIAGRGRGGRFAVAVGTAPLTWSAVLRQHKLFAPVSLICAGASRWGDRAFPCAPLQSSGQQSPFQLVFAACGGAHGAIKSGVDRISRGPRWKRRRGRTRRRHQTESGGVYGRHAKDGRQRLGLVVRLEVTWAECSTYSASWDFWRPAIAGWQLGWLTWNGDAGSVANNFAGHDDECMCIAAATRRRRIPTHNI